MRRAIVVGVSGFFLASLACGSSTAPKKTPPDALQGLYVGTAAAADIRVQVAYGELPSQCGGSSDTFGELLCRLLPDNLAGTSSIRVLQTGQLLTSTMRGFQRIAVGMILYPDNAADVKIWVRGTASPDGKTLTGYIGPTAGAPASVIFGDSAAVTLVRQN